MKVSEIMTPTILVIDTNASVIEAAKKMREFDVNGQAKSDQGGQVKETHLVENKSSLFLLSGHALLESVALPVHGQDVSMMGEAIEQGSGELFVVKDLGPL